MALWRVEMKVAKKVEMKVVLTVALKVGKTGTTSAVQMAEKKVELRADGWVSKRAESKVAL